MNVTSTNHGLRSSVSSGTNIRTRRTSGRDTCNNTHCTIENRELFVSTYLMATSMARSKLQTMVLTPSMGAKTIWGSAGATPLCSSRPASISLT